MWLLLPEQLRKSFACSAAAGPPSSHAMPPGACLRCAQPKGFRQHHTSSCSPCLAERARGIQHARCGAHGCSQRCHLHHSWAVAPACYAGAHLPPTLLLSLAGGPDVAVTLVGLGHAVGGAMAARHLVSPLLMVLVSSRSLLPPSQADTVPAPDGQPGLRVKPPGSGLQGTEGACRQASLVSAAVGSVVMSWCQMQG